MQTNLFTRRHFFFGTLLVGGFAVAFVIVVIVQKQRQVKNRLARQELAHSYSQAFTVAAHSRFTIDITGMVMLHLIQPADTYLGYEVSLTVQSNTGPFVAERPMYWNTGPGGTQGGSDIIGFV